MSSFDSTKLTGTSASIGFSKDFLTNSNICLSNHQWLCFEIFDANLLNHYFSTLSIVPITIILGALAMH